MKEEKSMLDHDYLVTAVKTLVIISGIALVVILVFGSV